MPSIFPRGQHTEKITDNCVRAFCCCCCCFDFGSANVLTIVKVNVMYWGGHISFSLSSLHYTSLHSAVFHHVLRYHRQTWSSWKRDPQHLDRLWWHRTLICCHLHRRLSSTLYVFYTISHATKMYTLYHAIFILDSFIINVVRICLFLSLSFIKHENALRHFKNEQ